MTLQSSVPAQSSLPVLVIDLDGSLLRSDLLMESFLALLAEHPLRALGALGTLWRGRAAFKRRVARQSPVDVALLPYSAVVLKEIAIAREQGRAVWLASASDEILLQRVADHLGLFDGVMGSDGARNLRGKAKADALVAQFGWRGFDYLGNSQTDVPVWEQAANVLVAHPLPKFLRQVKGKFPGARAVGHPGKPADRLAALRPHQWLKNLLVFVPILAAHRLDEAAVSAAGLAFLGIGLVASALYLVNDMLDLGRDRAHPTKRLRPLASGKLPIQEALVLIPILLVGAILACGTLPHAVLGVLGLYAAISLLYSLLLKRLIMLDIVTLACLYGVRLVLGSVAAGVHLSGWLGMFSLFLFGCLALAKRMTELAHARTRGASAGTLAGRGYQSGDEPLLAAMAAAAGMVAVLVFALYAASPDVRMLYHAPGHLWLVCPVMFYWIGRILMLAHRGTLPADPVIFAVTDAVSLTSILVAAGIVASAV